MAIGHFILLILLYLLYSLLFSFLIYPRHDMHIVSCMYMHMYMTFDNRAIIVIIHGYACPANDFDAMLVRMKDEGKVDGNNRCCKPTVPDIREL
jgi:hypothetical protein